MISFIIRQKTSFIVTAIVILVGLILSATAFLEINNWERQKLDVDFNRAAENLCASLEREIESDMQALLALKAFYLQSDKVTRAEFGAFSTLLLMKHPSIQAFEWIPRIPYSQREEYEKAAQRDGLFAFQIDERVAQRKMARAGQRKEYFPVYFVDPYEGNEIPLGFDLASDQQYKEILERSRDTGKELATARITLAQENANQSGFLIFSPVYKIGVHADSIQARRERLQGFILGVFRVGDIVKKSLTYLKPEGIDIYLYDTSAPEKEGLLYFDPLLTRRTPVLLISGKARHGELEYFRTFNVAGREWMVKCVPTPHYISAKRSLQPWIVLTEGLLLTGFLSGFLLVNFRRAEELAIAAERERTEKALRESEERFRNIFTDGPVGMVIMSPGHKVLAVNKALCEMLGYSEQELIGRSLEDITHTEDIEKSKEYAKQLFDACFPKYQLEKRYVRKDGLALWAKHTGSSIHGKEGEVLYGLGIIENITDRKKAEQKVHMLAYYDALTGLPNRNLFKDLLKRIIEDAKRHKLIFAILFIDLDDFKRINDTLGHDIGDQLLQAVSNKLLQTIRNSDYVACSYEKEIRDAVSRQGGDEFIVLMHNPTLAIDAGNAAHRLLKELSGPYEISGREIFITASIGISVYPEDGKDIDSLLKNADTAMYQAKKKGKNNYEFYSGQMNVASLERLTMESELYRALERNELQLYYQPKVSFPTGNIIGIEALIRWKHPNKGLISPAQFIQLAEAGGLIIPIGEFVLRTACLQNKIWQEAGFKRMSVAVNLSSRQFDQKDLLKIVHDAVNDIGLLPQHLELEITETAVMRNPEEAIQTLQELKAMGIKIALDDFGTGYSSLNYLKQLPLDFLKIDGSFVENVTSSSSDAAIVRTIIAMAHSLNLEVIAEGVETEQQLSFLREHGCYAMQGYFFSPPLPVEDISKILPKEIL